MAVVLVGDSLTKEDLITASKEYGEYIKIVVDIYNNLMTVGGEWHADGEKVLLEKGSKQEDVWGGGIDTKTKNIETTALINLRPKMGNDSQEMLDRNLREKFVKMVKEKFGL